jgi:hypothetical protein
VQKLIDAGLYGNSLMTASAVEITRYKECLRDMGVLDGVPVEKLEQIEALSFMQYDGDGWSPQVAQILGDSYLGHGDANLMLIVLSPRQRDLPSYRPGASFVRSLRRAWYDMHRPQVKFLTTRKPIWLALENEVVHYANREDLLMMNGVRVIAYTPDKLMVKARQQQLLVHQYHAASDPFELHRLLTDIAALATEVGDLTQQPVVIDDWQYSDVRSFFTRAFGGTFVLRPNGSHEHKLWSVEGVLAGQGIDSPSDREKLHWLEAQGLVSYELTWWREHLHRLDRIRESYLMDVLDVMEPELMWEELNGTQRIAALDRNVMLVAEEFHELSRMIDAIRDGRELSIEDVPWRIRAFLAHPSAEAEADEGLRKVAWHLLTLICDCRMVVRLYRENKDLFFTQYKEWAPVRKSWARVSILNENARRAAQGRE